MSEDSSSSRSSDSSVEAAAGPGGRRRVVFLIFAALLLPACCLAFAALPGLWFRARIAKVTAADLKLSEEGKVTLLRGGAEGVRASGAATFEELIPQALEEAEQDDEIVKRALVLIIALDAYGLAEDAEDPSWETSDRYRIAADERLFEVLDAAMQSRHRELEALALQAIRRLPDERTLDILIGRIEFVLGQLERRNRNKQAKRPDEERLESLARSVDRWSRYHGHFVRAGRGPGLGPDPDWKLWESQRWWWWRGIEDQELEMDGLRAWRAKLERGGLAPQVRWRGRRD